MKIYSRILILAVLYPLGMNGVMADDTYETLKDEAWLPAGEIRLESRQGMAPVGQLSDETLPLGTEYLSLGRLLEQVQNRNPTIESALNAWRSALAKYPQVTSLDDPMFAYSVAPQTLDQPTGLNGEQLDRGHILEVSQSFPWPGKLRLAGEAALLEAEGARADMGTVFLRLFRESKVAYYEYWYVERALEINAVNQGLLQEFQDIAETNYAAGRASKQDALQAEVEREHLAHQEIVLTRMREVTRARINMMLDRTPESHLPPPAETIPSPGAMPAVDGLIGEAMRNRPELHALQYRVEAREANIELARREYRPDFKVMGRYSSLWTNEERRFTIGAGINIPIQFGRRRGALDEARAERARLSADLSKEASEIAFHVKHAYETLKENHHVVGLYEDRLIPAAEENLDAAYSGYAAGEVDFLALITAQKLMMDTQLKRYEALASYHQADADLEFAIGGYAEESMLDGEVVTP